MMKLDKPHHLSVRAALCVAGALFALTFVTVLVARFDLGRMNFLVALLVASLKATLVLLFFMGLKYEPLENLIIFLTSIIFLTIFLALTSFDVFFRNEVYRSGPFLKPDTSSTVKFKHPWISSPELVAHGKAIFNMMCVTCHGEDGKGDGPAASSLVPPPRNFTELTGWKNGRTVSSMFKTLKMGLAPSAMASYDTMSVQDRFALIHYVTSFSQAPVAADPPHALDALGVNTAQETHEAVDAPTVPIDFILEEWSKDLMPSAQVLVLRKEGEEHPSSLFQKNCEQCHGVLGQGGILVTRNLVTLPLSRLDEPYFITTVVNGIPGGIMPGFGDLTPLELQELYRSIP